MGPYIAIFLGMIVAILIIFFTKGVKDEIRGRSKR